MYIPNYFQPIYRSHGTTNFATYARAIAALAVLIIHYGGLGLRSLGSSKNPINILLNNFVDFCGQGPVIFFVSSGFVLYLSNLKIYDLHKHPGAILFMKRWFRLVPAYALISWLSYKYFYRYTSGVDTFVWLKKIFFMDIFFPQTLKFSPIPIGNWIITEFWLTTILVMSLKIFNKRLFQGWLFNLSILISFSIHYLVSQTSYETNIIFNNLELNLGHLFYLSSSDGGGATILRLVLYNQFYFYCGIYLAHKTKDQRLRKVRAPIKRTIYMIFILINILIFTTNNYRGYLAFIWTMTFLALGMLRRTNKIFVPLIILGNICYSLYLLHLPIHDYLLSNFPSLSSYIITLIALISSVISFLFVENLFMVIFKKLSNK